MTMLALVSDLLLLAATAGVAAFCLIAMRRANRPAASDPDLSARLDALAAEIEALKAVRVEPPATPPADDDRLDRLQAAIAAADDRIGQLDLMLAGLEHAQVDDADAPGDPVAQPFEADPSVPMFRAARAAPLRRTTQ